MADQVEDMKKNSAALSRVWYQSRIHHSLERRLRRLRGTRAARSMVPDDGEKHMTEKEGAYLE